VAGFELNIDKNFKEFKEYKNKYIKVLQYYPFCDIINKFNKLGAN